MSRIILILLTILSISQCSKNPLLFLSGDFNAAGMADIFKGVIEALGIFHDIQFPASCDITDDQSDRFIEDLSRLSSGINDLVRDWKISEVVKQFKESTTDLYSLYSELYPICQDVAPAVSERVHKVVQYMFTLEYIAKFSNRAITESNRFEDELTEAVKVCMDGTKPDAAHRCGEKFGELVRDIFLWDYKQ
jgi:hypothetical protein